MSRTSSTSSRPRSRSIAKPRRGSPQRNDFCPPGAVRTGNGGGRSGAIAPSGLNGNVAAHCAEPRQILRAQPSLRPARVVLAVARDAARVDLRGAQLLAAHPQHGEAPEGLDETFGHHSVASQDVLPRAAAVATLASEPFDVLVIGGGITGAGVALDAATRGYSVALVERADFASGTSSRSSKLVHGGLRYLQNFDLGLVREALLERQINVNLAPAPRAAAAVGGPGVRGRAAGTARRPRPQRLRRDGGRPAAALAARAQARA